jgi:hypothetical protein
VNLPWSSGASIESDMTIKNPEKFTQSKLISQYLEKTEKLFSSILSDKSLDVAVISSQKRDAKKDKALYDKVQNKRAVLSTVKERLIQFIQRLQLKTGQEFYDLYKKTYFNNIKGLKDKSSDPFNILKIDKIDENRDCLYRFLSWNFPGKKSTAQVRAMSYKDICSAIEELKRQAINKGMENSSYFKLMREIRAFFDNELAKEQYDAFVDGPEACKHLIVSDSTVRAALLKNAKRMYEDISINVTMKLLETNDFLKKNGIN